MRFSSPIRTLTTALLALALLLPRFVSGAEQGFSLWVTFPPIGAPSETGAPREPVAVKAWLSERRREYFLFLPAGANTDGLRLFFTGAKKLTLDGTAVESGAPFNPLASFAGTRMATDGGKYMLQVMKSEKVPALFVSTRSGTLDIIHHNKDREEPGHLLILEAEGGVPYDGGLSQVKGRGNWTFSLAKKPYQFKLEEARDLFGLGRSKTWILLANHYDNSLLRNRVVLDLAGAAGLPYSSKSRAVDLYVNQEYRGAYLLCEKVEIGDSRVDIRDLEKATEKANQLPLSEYPPFNSEFGKGSVKGRRIPGAPGDISGGYLLELEYYDRYLLEPSGFVTSRGQPVLIKEPRYASRGQVEYIYTFMQGFENAVFAEDGIDPLSRKHYSEFVDLESLAKKYLIEEISKNYDGNRSSLFFYKPADGQSALAYCGPAWDYDIALGNYATSRNLKMIIPQFFITNQDRGEPYYLFP
ncbi:MAG: hypothetical protein GX623_07890, partial [Clostridiales bacterium]|nr:hypothetical protein [Clostridiales bacterium]